MAEFGISFSDVADDSPRQERTMEACTAAIRFAAENRHLLDGLLKTGKLPLAQLAAGSGAERKNTGTAPEVHTGDASDPDQRI